MWKSSDIALGMSRRPWDHRDLYGGLLAEAEVGKAPLSKSASSSGNSGACSYEKGKMFATRDAGIHCQRWRSSLVHDIVTGSWHQPMEQK